MTLHYVDIMAFFKGTTSLYLGDILCRQWCRAVSNIQRWLFWAIKRKLSTCLLNFYLITCNVPWCTIFNNACSLFSISITLSPLFCLSCGYLGYETALCCLWDPLNISYSIANCHLIKTQLQVSGENQKCVLHHLLHISVWLNAPCQKNLLPSTMGDEAVLWILT